MTAPTPPTTPILQPARLAVWAQERPLLDPEFADLVLEAVDVLLREKGDAFWTAQTIPARARDIGYIVAKDYYLNPTLIRQESLGPIQETRADLVLNGIHFTEAQELEIQQLAGGTEDDGSLEGLWSVSVTRGPVETHKGAPNRTAYIYDTRGAWPIPYLTEDEAIVFIPEEPVV